VSPSSGKKSTYSGGSLGPVAENTFIQGIFPYLKKEAEPAFETACFVKNHKVEKVPKMSLFTQSALCLPFTNI
jgi:hypothetical protein